MIADYIPLIMPEAVVGPLQQLFGLNITSNNFSVNFAGSSTGTLYGRGLYFAEHCTKADEYANADKDGLHTVLVCRVTLGNVFYTAEPEPDAQACAKLCMSGDEHCILGDRIK